jgi:hypothetical protein
MLHRSGSIVTDLGANAYWQRKPKLDAASWTVDRQSCEVDD